MDSYVLEIIIAAISSSPTLLIALAWVNASEKRVQRYEERLFDFQNREGERVDELIAG